MPNNMKERPTGHAGLYLQDQKLHESRAAFAGGFAAAETALGFAYPPFFAVAVISALMSAVELYKSRTAGKSNV